MSNRLKAELVDFGDDEIKALYIDGKLQLSGDNYHDKIESGISGFLLGAEWAGKEFDLIHYHLPHQNDMSPPGHAPEHWPDDHFSKKTKRL